MFSFFIMPFHIGNTFGIALLYIGRNQEKREFSFMFIHSLPCDVLNESTLPPTIIYLADEIYRSWQSNKLESFTVMQLPAKGIAYIKRKLTKSMLPPVRVKRVHVATLESTELMFREYLQKNGVPLGV